MRRKEAKKKGWAQHDKECCATCYRYSASGMRASGFCMKKRSSVKWSDYCGYYDPLKR